MLTRFRSWWRQRDLQRARRREPIDAALWSGTLARYPFLDDLSLAERARLRDLVHLFLDRKVFTTAHDLPLTEDMRLSVAAQACILILDLDIRYYDGWSGIVLYPTQFLPRHRYVDAMGITHDTEFAHSGEAWLGGPVILSWDDVEQSGESDGMNVVIHEFAHKLDMLNGNSNGFPPLHADMQRERWAQVFSHAYAGLCATVERGHYTPIDPYATEAPEEYFAVISEVFFERPDVVLNHYPEVYEQLRLFYRQDPHTRMLRAQLYASAPPDHETAAPARH